MPPDDLDEQIRAKEAELAELRGQRPRPLTLAEIRSMSKEEVDREWQRVRQSLAAEPREDKDKVSRESARAHLERGFAASDPKARREERQVGRGPRSGLEGSDDGGD
jgi:ribosomal protein L29